MAVITINKRLFEKEVGKIDEKMKEKIEMFGTPIELINDNEIHLEIFANRPDMLSYQGFKRAFLGFIGKKKGIEKYSAKKGDYKLNIDQSVKTIRPFTSCGVIKNIKLDDEKIREIIEIQEKLHSTIGRKRKKVAIGIYPLEKIKFPITYKALSPEEIRFIPLGEKVEMTGIEIIKNHPKGKEYGNLLENKRLFPIFIDSNNQIMSMPPIINSELCGKVETATRNLFIECSGENELILDKCLNIIITALSDMGGEIYEVELTNKSLIKSSQIKTTPNLKTEKLGLSTERLNKLLGLGLNEKEIKELLEKMRHNYSNNEVEYSCYRTDIIHEIDLIEDVAIAYGYDNFLSEIPRISTTGKESQKEIIKRKISEILTGLKFLEISNYHLTINEDQTKKMNDESEGINLKSSKTEYNSLRKNLSHYLLKIFSENIDSEYPQNLFEVGKIFYKEKGQIIERESLSIGMSPGNYTELRRVVEYLGRMIDLEINFKESERNIGWSVKGRCADIIINGKIVGYMTETHPKILKNWKIKMPVVLMELDLEEIISAHPK